MKIDNLKVEYIVDDLIYEFLYKGILVKNRIDNIHDSLHFFNVTSEVVEETYEGYKTTLHKFTTEINDAIGLCVDVELIDMLNDSQCMIGCYVKLTIRQKNETLAITDYITPKKAPTIKEKDMSITDTKPKRVRVPIIYHVVGLRYENDDVVIMFQSSKNEVFTLTIKNFKNYFNKTNYIGEQYDNKGEYIGEGYLINIQAPLPDLELAVKYLRNIFSRVDARDCVSVAIYDIRNKNNPPCFTEWVKEWVSITDTDKLDYRTEDVKFINGSLVIKIKPPSGESFNHSILAIGDEADDKNYIGDYRDSSGDYSVHRTVMWCGAEEDVSMVLDFAKGISQHNYNTTKVRVAFHRRGQFTTFSDWVDEEKPSTEPQEITKHEVNIESDNIILRTTNDKGKVRTMTLGSTGMFGNVETTVSGFSVTTNDGKKIFICVDTKGRFSGIDIE